MAGNRNEIATPEASAASAAERGIAQTERTHHSSVKRMPARADGSATHGVIVACLLPGDPPGPCPELLTEAEAARYLRLDEIDVDDPTETLRYYRRKGLLRATQVGKRVRYRRVELERFLERITDVNPR